MKSPLKDKPLRHAGESLDREIRDYALDHIAFYLFLASMFGLMALLEWYGWYFATTRNPWLYTAIFLLFLPFVFVKVRKARAHLKNLKQGRDGEKVVGQSIEDLRSIGCRIFHDIPGKNFNLDHVVIAPTGIFVLETKTWSKPEKGNSKIRFNGDDLILNGAVRNEPLAQAKAAAKWLQDLLKHSTSQHFPVRPIVVFPGWFVEQTAAQKKQGVSVLNPKCLGGLIANGPMQLSQELIAMASRHLSLHVLNSSET